jgi:DNA-binding response OmpR family regulator
MRALVVDDDRILSDLLAFTLRKEGFEITQAFDGATALSAWENEQPDIIILDVNLPKTVPALDGFMVCEKIRAVSDTPIILLTVRNEEDDIVHGLKMGADDYVLKPFSPRQLVARVQTVLRRSGQSTFPAIRSLASLVFDPGRREITFPDGKSVTLTPLENRLLDCLSRRENHYVTTDELIAEVWGHEKGNREMLRQLVRRLRSKIEKDSVPDVTIANLPGLGYGLLTQTGSSA